MARLIVNQGLQVIGDRASSVSGAGAAITSMIVDNLTAASQSFVSSHTALINAAAVASSARTSFTGLPTRAAQTVSHVALFPTTDANFQIGRVSLHNNSTATASTASLIGGIDQQNLTKTTDFSLQIQVDITYTSA